MPPMNGQKLGFAGYARAIHRAIQQQHPTLMALTQELWYMAEPTGQEFNTSRRVPSSACRRQGRELVHLRHPGPCRNRHVAQFDLALRSRPVRAGELIFHSDKGAQGGFSSAPRTSCASWPPTAR